MVLYIFPQVPLEEQNPPGRWHQVNPISLLYSSSISQLKAESGFNLDPSEDLVRHTQTAPFLRSFSPLPCTPCGGDAMPRCPFLVQAAAKWSGLWKGPWADVSGPRAGAGQEKIHGISSTSAENSNLVRPHDCAVFRESLSSVDGRATELSHGNTSQEKDKLCLEEISTSLPCGQFRRPNTSCR